MKTALVDVKTAVAAVRDPELPFVTIGDLGILRGVEADGDRITVTITPTYSGCPAMDAIRTDVARAAAAAGHPDVRIRTVLSPAWSTDWITAEGRRKLADAGVSPPGPARPLASTARPVMLAISVRCPRCGSPETTEISRFGPTACTALWRCRACAEPFEHMKAI